MVTKIRQLQFLVCFIIFSIFISLPAFAAGFDYRVPITIKNSGQELADFQVKITLDTERLLAEDKISPSCADVRFTDSKSFDNSSWTKPYPFWVDYLTCGTKETVFWVKVDNIPAGGEKNIYAYYGAEIPEYGSSGKETFDFYQDFDKESADFKDRQPQGWVDSAFADVSVSDLEAFRGENSMLVQGTADNAEPSYTILPEQLKKFVLDLELYPNQTAGALNIGTGSRPAILQFGRCGANEIPVSHWGYSSHLYEGYWKDNWYDGGYYEPNKWYQISYKTDGTYADISIDGIRKVGNKRVDDDHPTQRIETWGDSDCLADKGIGGFIDTIRLRKYSVIEPAVSVGGEEEPITTPSFSALLRDWYSPGKYQYSSFNSYPYSFSEITENQIAGKNYYSKNQHLFYYTITYPNGTEETLKTFNWNSGTVTRYENVYDPYYTPNTRYHYYSIINIPQQYFSVDTSSGGHYKLELKQIEIPAIMSYKNPKEKYGLDDTLDYWKTDFVKQLRYLFNQGPGYYREHIETLCANQEPVGNITTKQIIFDRNGNTITGSDNCGSVNMDYASSFCNYGYSDNEETYPSPGSRNLNHNDYCWLEKRDFKTVKVSELPKKTVWKMEFDIEEPEAAAVVSPFVQDSGSNNEGTNGNNDIAVFPLAAGAAAVAAGAYAIGIFAGKGRIKNIKSGFTAYGAYLKNKAKTVLSFIEQEKDGYWSRRFDTETAERLKASAAWDNYIRKRAVITEDPVRIPVSNIVSNFEAVVNDIQKTIPIIPNIVNSVKDVFTGILHTANDFVSKAIETVKPVIDDFKGFFSDLLKPVKKAVSGVIETVKDMATPIFRAIKPAVELVKSPIERVTEVLSTVLPEVKSPEKNVTITPVGKLVDFILPVQTKRAENRHIDFGNPPELPKIWTPEQEEEAVLPPDGEMVEWDSQPKKSGISSRIGKDSKLFTETKAYYKNLRESKKDYIAKKWKEELRLQDEWNRNYFSKKAKEDLYGETKDEVLRMIEEGVSMETIALEWNDFLNQSEEERLKPVEYSTYMVYYDRATQLIKDGLEFLGGFLKSFFDSFKSLVLAGKFVISDFPAYLSNWLKNSQDPIGDIASVLVSVGKAGLWVLGHPIEVLEGLKELSKGMAEYYSSSAENKGRFVGDIVQLFFGGEILKSLGGIKNLPEAIKLFFNTLKNEKTIATIIEKYGDDVGRLVKEIEVNVGRKLTEKEAEGAAKVMKKILTVEKNQNGEGREAFARYIANKKQPITDPEKIILSEKNKSGPDFEVGDEIVEHSRIGRDSGKENVADAIYKRISVKAQQLKRYEGKTKTVLIEVGEDSHISSEDIENMASDLANKLDMPEWEGIDKIVIVKTGGGIIELSGSSAKTVGSGIKLAMIKNVGEIEAELPDLKKGTKYEFSESSGHFLDTTIYGRTMASDYKKNVGGIQTTWWFGNSAEKISFYTKPISELKSDVKDWLGESVPRFVAKHEIGHKAALESENFWIYYFNIKSEKVRNWIMNKIVDDVGALDEVTADIFAAKNNLGAIDFVHNRYANNIGKDSYDFYRFLVKQLREQAVVTGDKDFLDAALSVEKKYEEFMKKGVLFPAAIAVEELVRNDLYNEGNSK
ncbi:MAG: DUF2341 domain-containing protein [Candidatus Aenigmarchaeota archaeon]|nr:DUF2341 domain-containing protein [Candidatus Aenigmarchaeota archaeon]